MIHYLYLLTFLDGKKYIGARSTKLDNSDLDVTYLGSGRYLPERSLKTCTKTILAEFQTREELIEAEINYIKDNNCVKDSSYYNARLSTYDRFGDTCTAISHKLKGRSKETHDYIAKANAIKKKYVGENRTPAQKHRDAAMLGVSTGSNLSKGHKGTSNCAFDPWYSIDPNGVRTEYHDITKKDAAHLFGLTPRQMTHRFHYTNIDKPAKTGAIKGWVFGNL